MSVERALIAEQGKRIDDIESIIQVDPESPSDSVLAPSDTLYYSKGAEFAEAPITGNERCFVYSTDTTASDPGAGGIKFNNVNLAAATQMYISSITTSGISFSGLAKLMVPDDRGVVNDFEDQTRALLYRFTQNPIDNGTWFTAQIQSDDAGFPIADGTIVSTGLYFTGPRAALSALATTTWTLPLPLSATTYDSGYDPATSLSNGTSTAWVEITAGGAQTDLYKTVPVWLLTSKPNVRFTEAAFFEGIVGEVLITQWYDTVTTPLTPSVKVRIYINGAGKTIANAALIIS